VRLAIEGGCSAVASTLGVLGACSRRYAHRIPFVLKLNHNELLTFPNRYDQVMFAAVKQAWDMGAAAVGATVYFGSAESGRQIREVAEAFQAAHELGLATILWCYLRNAAFKQGGTDYHEAADLTGQANHLGVTLEADVIKQKLPTTDRGYAGVSASGGAKFRPMPERAYERLSGEHPIDRCRCQVLHCYTGRIGLINSGGASVKVQETGDAQTDRRNQMQADLAEAVRTAVVNKRAGGMGLISGRKAFQKAMADGVALLNAIQDVYLCRDIGLA
jgi:class I fructose-bisphosphate aldolase